MPRVNEAKEPEWFNSGGRRYWMWGRQRRTAILEPLGELVVKRYRAELESGTPIRWKKHCASLAKDVRKPLHELLGRFAHYVEGAGYFSGIAVMFGRAAEAKKDAARRQQAYKRFRAYVIEMAEKMKGA